MVLPGIDLLRPAARQLRKCFTSKAIILMYHRVTEYSSDPWRLCVTPDSFAQQLEVLQQYSHPIRLQDLVQALQERTIPRRAVVVTFDDGYADNLYNAKPLLEQYNLPATIFLSSAYIGHNREFWWDDLARLVLQPGTLPDTLHLRMHGRTYQWELGEAAHYSPEEHQCCRTRRAWEGAPHSRLALYYSLWQRLRLLPRDERQQTLDELATWTGLESTARPTHRPLSCEEVHALGQGELIELGAHTFSHPFLSAHAIAVQEEEIKRGKAHLEDMVARPVRSFAYPHGDYTAETRALVQAAGFTCACSTVAESVWHKTDEYQLPRFAVHNWNGEEFARRLWSWLQR
jgi:peptidoglycan/xylan/chitin deacetylase (PgdA/CDA1 family)